MQLNDSLNPLEIYERQKWELHAMMTGFEQQVKTGPQNAGNAPYAKKRQLQSVSQLSLTKKQSQKTDNSYTTLAVGMNLF